METTVLIRKYPKTAYWPHSPNLVESSRALVHPNPHRFVGTHIVVTEKLDGSNTLVHRGQVYGRNVTDVSDRKWMAMVKKHIAWKIQEPDVVLCGEDIYAVHSIEYGPVVEDRTFYAFALRRGDCFAPFSDLEAYADLKGIATVPVLYRGKFDTLAALRGFVASAHDEPSVLSGEREGVVIWTADGFPAGEFNRNVCKSVRANHVTTGDDWKRTWRPCRTVQPGAIEGCPG